MFVFGALAILQAQEQPFVLQAGPEWTPIPFVLDVVPGSALDWSNTPRVEPGKLGRLIVGANGHFVYEKAPDKPIKFYGTNITFSSMFMTHEQSDMLAARLRRMGYNAVRLHHYDGELTGGGEGGDPRDSTLIDSQKMERLDYLVSALARQGMMLSIDLYTIRRIRPGEIFDEALPMDEYKAALLVSQKARDNWAKFARNLLEHVNPYTKRAWKDEPALGWIALVNEGNAGSAARTLSPEVQKLFDAEFAKNGGEGTWKPTTPEGARLGGKLHRETTAWMTKALRDMGVKSLLTSDNGWLEQRVLIEDRAQLDYVDNHWYWDHPRFLESDWQLPSSGWDQNKSYLASWGAGLRVMPLTRLVGKPFTVTEFNFSGPNTHRAEAGLVFGSVAARQDWDGVWRYAWSGGEEQILKAAPMGYFDAQSDPLAQATEKAILALFLKGDLARARATTTLTVDPKVHPDRGYDADYPGSKLLTSRLQSKIGSDKFETSDETTKMVRSSPGVIEVETDRTAGLAGPAGSKTAGACLSAELKKTFGSLWASSLDGRPLRSSRRILLTYVTDVQNTGETFADTSMLVLRAWGGLPHLARNGSAHVRMNLANPKQVSIHRLNFSGRRVEVWPHEVRGDVIEFDVAIGPKSPGFYWEIVR